LSELHGRVAGAGAGAGQPGLDQQALGGDQRRSRDRTSSWSAGAAGAVADPDGELGLEILDDLVETVFPVAGGR